MARWVVVVPVKRLAVAKTRLALADPLRRELALAFTTDTVRAAYGCDQVGAVIVVTDDPDVARAVNGVGAHVLADAPARGLNAALSHGAASARARYSGSPVAAVVGDLPALTGEALGAVLAAAGRLVTAFVPDAAATGTTALCASDAALFRPAFGPGSAAAHALQGAGRLDASAGVRLDVDTLEDLQRATELGVGRSTAAVLCDVATG